MLKYDQLSYWEKTEYLEHLDVVIIGSGIVGMCTALALIKEKPKLNITLIERGYLPTGASTKNAGFACFGSPTELQDDLNRMSNTEVWDTLEMRYRGLQKLFEIIPREHMNYEACGSWDLLFSDQKIEEDFLQYLNQEIQRITQQKCCFSYDEDKIYESGFLGFKHAYHNRLEGSLFTHQLIRKLHAKCVSLEIKFLFGTEVINIEQSASGCRLNTQFGEIRSQKIVVCTNGFAKQLLDLTVEPARAQVLVTRPIANLKVKGTFHFDSGYYYFRNLGDRLLFGGGRNMDFNSENTTDMHITEPIQTQLISLLKSNILPNQMCEIDYQWAGTMGIGPTKQPIIEKIGKHIVVGVRMGGMGVAIGALVGEKLSNLVLNE